MNHEPEFPYTSNIVGLESDGQISIYTLNDFKVVVTLEGLDVYDAIKNIINVLDTPKMKFTLSFTGEDKDVYYAVEYLKSILNERK